MLIKTMDTNAVVNMDNVLFIGLSTENISRDYEAVITAYFNNGDEKILGKYQSAEGARDKLNKFYRACHERNNIFDF